MPSNVESKIEALDRMIWSKQTWLDTHGSKRTAHEVETQRANLDMLTDIRTDYALSLARAKERASS